MHIHERSYSTLSSKRSLQQSQKRKEKENAENSPSIPEQQDLLEKECQPSSPKCLRSLIGRPLYRKNKCLWCRKGSDKKNPTRKIGKLMQISTLSGWIEFKRHMVSIKDELLCLQLSKLAEAVSAFLDPFAADLMYHFPRWRDYISNLHFDPKETIHLQNLTYSDMKQIYLKGRSDYFCRAQNLITSITSTWI